MTIGSPSRLAFMCRPNLFKTRLALAMALLASTLASQASATQPAIDAAASEAPAPPPPKKLGPFYSPIDLQNWLLNFQATYILQRKPGLNAAYSGPNSLFTDPETGYTLSTTVYLGFRPWTGAEIFFNPETIQSRDISNLTGLGGQSNGENQKGGGPLPNIYLARLFLRQTIDMKGEPSAVSAEPNQFAGTVSRRRFVVTLGFLSVMDVFDPNAISHDPRTSFLNWATWTYGASDFAADSRGYTFGLALEFYFDDWAFRLGRFAQPKESNGLPLDYNIIDHYGDVLELEHSHTILGQRGALRVTGFHNRANMGSFRDALDAAQGTGEAPKVANVRKDQSKFAFGINLEQAITQDLGLFGRFSWNDGRRETYAYAEIDRSLVLGATMKGRLWLRPDDTLGFAWAINGISGAHRDYLAAGGLGFFIGDGRLTYGPESILEAFYSAKVFSSLWFSVTGQHIIHPAYNVERGPAEFIGLRIHLEY